MYLNNINNALLDHYKRLISFQDIYSTDKSLFLKAYEIQNVPYKTTRITNKNIKLTKDGFKELINIINNPTNNNLYTIAKKDIEPFYEHKNKGGRFTYRVNTNKNTFKDKLFSSIYAESNPKIIDKITPLTYRMLTFINLFLIDFDNILDNVYSVSFVKNDCNIKIHIDYYENFDKLDPQIQAEFYNFLRTILHIYSDNITLVYKSFEFLRQN